MDGFGFVTLVVTGFTACAEFGSFAFVHPVIRRLPPASHLEVEQGLLRTFGRVMPSLMTLCVVLSINYALNLTGAAPSTDGASLVRWLAAGSFGLALISTIIFNVPINRATGSWSRDHPPTAWKATRNRWEFFQGVRSWLLLLGFVLVSLAITQ